MDQLEGVNGQLLPWEGDRLTPQVRSTSAMLPHCAGRFPYQVCKKMSCIYSYSGTTPYSFRASASLHMEEYTHCHVQSLDNMLLVLAWRLSACALVSHMI
jgi:hypothetical protein